MGLLDNLTINDINDMLFLSPNKQIIDLIDLEDNLSDSLKQKLKYSRNKLKNIIYTEDKLSNGIIGNHYLCTKGDRCRFKFLDKFQENDTKYICYFPAKSFLNILKRIRKDYKYVLKHELWNIDFKTNPIGQMNTLNYVFDCLSGDTFSICTLAHNLMGVSNVAYKSIIFQDVLKFYFVFITKYFPNTCFFTDNQYTEEFYKHRILFINAILNLNRK